MKSSRRVTHQIKRGALAAACALALGGPALAADDELRVRAAVALHEFDTLVVFAEGPSGWENDFGARMGTLGGMVDITDQCAVNEVTGKLVQIRCDFDDGLPEDGDFLLELSAGFGQLGLPFSFAIGRQGDQGAQGPQGVVGPQGAAGVPGPQGIPGVDGAQGVVGPQGPVGILGVIGEQGVVGTPGLPGPQGPVGNAGPVGQQGSLGTTGAQGLLGDQGPQGPQGQQGPSGDTGVAGIVGEQGPLGPQGDIGLQGTPGDSGPVGIVGLDGPVGPQGLAGAAGQGGPVGDTGAIGPMGPVGAMGPTGPVGAAGPVGETGMRGPGGTVSLITREVLPYGSACAFGGQQIRAGRDLNDNGILDPNEVQQTGVVCNDGVWTGVRSFDTCGAAGRLGPDTSACATTYASTTLDGEVTVVAGVQEWTVPASGTYRITAAGGQGGYLGGVVSGGGLGARVSADVDLVAGEVLRILVGHSGFLASNGNEAGGGGGSFVVHGTAALLVAGGGGSHGGCSAYDEPNSLGLPGNTSTAGTAGKPGWGIAGGVGGTDGSGGGAITNDYPGGAGGGLLTSGEYGQRFWSGCDQASSEPGMIGLDADPMRTAGGLGFMDGGIGGRGCYDVVEGQGGFGGGGGGGGCGGAGGGGYSGGGGGAGDSAGGGGGASFTSGINAVLEDGVNSGNGSVAIDRVF